MIARVYCIYVYISAFSGPVGTAREIAGSDNLRIAVCLLVVNDHRRNYTILYIDHKKGKVFTPLDFLFFSRQADNKWVKKFFS